MANISVLESQLLDEYFRCERALNIHRRALVQNDTKGYISVKRIGSRKYHYLQWREGSKVCSRYIRNDELKRISDSIEARKQHQSSIRNLENNIRQLKKVLGRKLIEEYRSAV